MDIKTALTVNWTLGNSNIEDCVLEVVEIFKIGLITKSKADKCLAYIANNEDEINEFMISMNATDTVDLIRDLV